MAIKAYHLDKRTLVTPTVGGELANLQSTLNLKEYIKDVVDSSDIEFASIIVDDINLGDDIIGDKEVDHTISVTTTTTAATAGGALILSSGQGATSGNGGALTATSGAGGLTGAGGVITVTSGAGGATSGASGNITVATGAATVGSSGTLALATGNTASGVAGDITLTPGTHTSATVSPVISLNKAVVKKPTVTSIATGATATGPELVGGNLSVTGATGNVTLPTAAQITTAIGSTPAGTTFDFCVNAHNMTATNTVTMVVGSNMTVSSSPAITGGGTLTVTQDTQVIGWFRITYNTATTCKIQRIA